LFFLSRACFTEENIKGPPFDIHEFGLELLGDKVYIYDEIKLKRSIERLVRIAVFDSAARAAWAQFLIRISALELGVIPSSIQDLYIARGKGEVPPIFTVPAINLRTLSYDAARAAFRSARKINSSMVIFEIARVELVWGGISLTEYTACILGAAIAEEYTGPVFLQGDHFQLSSQLPLQDEILTIKGLVTDAIQAGFYNIDIDASTLVDLNKHNVDEQQYLNAEVSANLASFIRNRQPADVVVSIGGEIGEVGGHITTTEELHSYLRQFTNAFAATNPSQPGLSKISIHTGTTHGGIALPDGSIARPVIDFAALQKISAIGQQSYGLGGVVQHGASTLPIEEFGQLVHYGALEVHLATLFMTTVFKHLPPDLDLRIHNWLDMNYAHIRSNEMTESQFYHKVEMHALAPFKKALWNLPVGDKEIIIHTWESQFDLLFQHLGCANSRSLVEKYIRPVIVQPILDLTAVPNKGAQPSAGLSG